MDKPSSSISRYSIHSSKQHSSYYKKSINQFRGLFPFQLIFLKKIARLPLAKNMFSQHYLELLKDVTQDYDSQSSSRRTSIKKIKQNDQMVINEPIIKSEVVIKPNLFIEFKKWVLSQVFHKVSLNFSFVKNGIEFGANGSDSIYQWNQLHPYFMMFVNGNKEILEKQRIKFSMNQKNNNCIAHYSSMDLVFHRIPFRYKFDVVYCNDCIYRGFHSLEKAEIMLDNLENCINTGGILFGMIIDGDKLLQQVAMRGSTFGNSCFSIKFHDGNFNKSFGVSFEIQIKGNAKSFRNVISFPLLQDLLYEKGLELICKEQFHDYYKIAKKDPVKIRELCLKQILIKEDSKYKNNLNRDERELLDLYTIFMFKKL